MAEPITLVITSSVALAGPMPRTSRASDSAFAVSRVFMRAWQPTASERRLSYTTRRLAAAEWAGGAGRSGGLVGFAWMCHVGRVGLPAVARGGMPASEGGWACRGAYEARAVRRAVHLRRGPCDPAAAAACRLRRVGVEGDEGLADAGPGGRGRQRRQGRVCAGVRRARAGEATGGRRPHALRDRLDDQGDDGGAPRHAG